MNKNNLWNAFWTVGVNCKSAASLATDRLGNFERRSIELRSLPFPTGSRTDGTNPKSSRWQPARQHPEMTDQNRKLHLERGSGDCPDDPGSLFVHPGALPTRGTRASYWGKSAKLRRAVAPLRGQSWYCQTCHWNIFPVLALHSSPACGLQCLPVCVEISASSIVCMCAVGACMRLPTLLVLAPALSPKWQAVLAHPSVYWHISEVS